jgi:hypothetical protein
MTCVMQCDVDTTTIETAIDSASPTAARQSRGRHGPASHALHSLQISLAAVERWQPSHPRVAVHQRCACQGITRGHDVVSHTHSLSLSLTHTHTGIGYECTQRARTQTDVHTPGDATASPQPTPMPKQPCDVLPHAHSARPPSSVTHAACVSPMDTWRSTTHSTDTA